MKKRKLTQIAAWVTFPVMVWLLVGFPFSLPGRENTPGKIGNLKGFIYKRNGKNPLWGAQVLLKDVKTGKIFESNVTDAVGDYKCIDIPEGKYKLKILVKDKDYEVKRVDFLVRIFEGKTTSLSFALKKHRRFFLFAIPLCKIFAVIVLLLKIT